ncbi:hypothetical protein K1719_011290 [Acacia pycnantha]|nr:hypothetical protein K1719_011290 [Acacia pycnantha]
MKQVTLYLEGKESFNRVTCKKGAEKLDPYEWWMRNRLEHQRSELKKKKTNAENLKGNEDMHIVEPPALNDDVTTTYAFPNPAPNVSSTIDLLDEL